MISPPVTDDYPDAPPKFEERFRGEHVLQRDVNGMEKCVACFLCAAACPANCIYIEARRTTNRRGSAARAYRKVYNIDYNRCIFLRLLRGGLPDGCDHARTRLEMASYNTSTLVKRKEDMLAPIPPGAKAPVMEDARPGALADGRIARPTLRICKQGSSCFDYPGADRYDFPRGSGREECPRNLPVLSGLPGHRCCIVWRTRFIAGV